jgi:putative endonuclease
MFLTYIIWSDRLKRYYIGSTNDIDKRLKEHNYGKSKFTKKGIPWKLIKIEKLKSRQEAYKREFIIKSFKGGIQFKHLIGEVAQWPSAAVY